MADLTIIIPSYNKAKYISQTLDSVFAQKTTYGFKIIVADDGSTDGTVEIVKQYQEKYPDKITLLTSDKNQKLYKNVLRAYEITDTDYFCVLDPDDYWIDENKTQKALDFLETHKDYTIYGANIVVKNSEGSQDCYVSDTEEVDNDFNDFLLQKAVVPCTQSAVFRNVIFKNGIPEKMKNLTCPSQLKSYRGDSFRNLIHIHEGKSHYSPDKVAVYRLTEEGIFAGSLQIEQYLLNANFYKDAWLYYDKKYPEFLVQSKKMFNNANSVLLANIVGRNGLKQSIADDIISLKKIYDENAEIIAKTQKKMLSLKYKIFLMIYKFVSKKLIRKGLV